MCLTAIKRRAHKRAAEFLQQTLICITFTLTCSRSLTLAVVSATVLQLRQIKID